MAQRDSTTKALTYLAGKKMPDVDSWQVVIAIILASQVSKSITVSDIAMKALLTEKEVVKSLKRLITSGFKMQRNKQGNLLFNVGTLKYTISIPKKQEPVKETGSMEMFDGGGDAKIETGYGKIDKKHTINGELMDAIQSRDLIKIDQILKSGPIDMAYVAPNNQSILTIACERQDLNVLTRLVEYGINVNEGLMWACQQGNDYRGLVPFFIKHGAEVNPQDGGLLPLQWAIFAGAVGIAQELIENGADVNFISASGEPLLQAAVDSDNKLIVELMIMNGVSLKNKNLSGDGPLHWAVMNGSSDILRMLIYNGADKDIVNNDGKTARDLAISVGKDKVAEMLKSR